MGKRGYDVSGIKPERVAKKDITRKELQKLQKLTNEEIYKKAGGEEKQKEELSRRAKKGWRTRRRAEERKTGWQKSKEKHPEAPRISHRLPKPEEPPVPEPPGPEPLPPGPDEGLTDEEQAALDRFEDDLTLFNSGTKEKMNNWFNSIVAQAGYKAAARMLADGYNSGIEFKHYAPSMDEGTRIDICNSFRAFLPAAMTDEQKQQNEDEWQSLIDEIANDENYFDWD